jgi:signal transduction histidine kinase
VLGTLVSTWFAYDRVRAAVESEFERRLLRIASTAASQITPDLVREVRRLGDETGAYSSIDVQLVTLRSATGIEDASLVDSTGIVLVDAAAPDLEEGLTSALDSLAGPAFRRALGGHAALSGVFRRDGRPLRAGFAPVLRPGGATGAIVVVAEAPYVGVLAGLGRTLGLVLLLSAIGTAVLATLIFRQAASAARLERRLSRAENLAAMGRLTATLAHEIKNPLAIIRGSAERLLKLEPESRRMADFVIEEADRLSNTVSRYLAFARADEGSGETGDAAAALDATLALLEGEFNARRVVVERAARRPGPARVALDNESLKQVYLNLILNALEAMPDGGRLTIEETERAQRIEVGISDQGPGIPPDVLKRLGTPFFTTKAKGSGLGLFLSRRLVQAAGGDLTIASAPGRGTTCTVWFPRQKG